MADLGDLILRLKVDSSEYERDLRRARSLAEGIDDVNVNLDARGIDGINRQLGKVDKSVGAVGKSFGGLQGVIAGASAAITSSLISVGAAVADIPRQIAAISLNNFREFDAELQQFSALTGKARDDIQPLREEIQRLGIETTKAPTEIAAAANSLITLGASAETVQDQLAGVVALSEATGVGLDQAAQLIQLSANAFGEGSDEIADKLSVLRNTTAASVGDVQQLLQQTAGVFNALGEDADTDELLALFATLRDGSQSAETAATGLRGVIATLVDPGKADELKSLGVQAFDAQGNFLGLETVLRQLQQTQGELNPGEFTGRLVAAFGREGVATVTGGLDLLDSKFTTTLENIRNASGTAAESSAILTQGFAGSIAILQGSLETLSIAFGEAIAPLVQLGAEFVTQIANALLTTEGLFAPITAAIEQFRATILGTPELVDTLVQGFVDLAASGVEGIAAVLTEVARFFEDPQNISAVATSFREFVSGVSDIVALIGPVAAATLEISSFAAKVSELIGSIPILGNVLLNPVNAFDSLRRTLAILKPLIDGARVALNLTSGVVEALSTPFQTLDNIITGLIERVRELASTLGIENLRNIIVNAGGTAGRVVNDLFNAIPRKHGGAVLPGQTYLAGEAGPELLKINGMESLITQPQLMRFDQPGRIYSAPQTKRRLNSSAVKRDSVTTQVAQLNKMMRQIMTSPRGTVQTDVHIEGLQPDAVRRQLAMHQIDLYRGLGGI